MARTSAVFFDVDFTLIRPGPRFDGIGYQACCASHGVVVDPARFDAAVAGAAEVLESTDHVYDGDVFVSYTRRIIALMGGDAPGADAAARELYREWAEHRHFALYDDVIDALSTLCARGIRLGLISNSHRSLDSFKAHFALEGFISVAVSSPDHGYMKPHPSIFRTALARMGVRAEEAVMVGDSLTHDVAGARRAGMRGVLLARGPAPARLDPDVPVIRSLRDLASVLDRHQAGDEPGATAARGPRYSGS